YDTSADPSETKDLSSTKPAVAASLRANLEKYVAHPTQITSSTASPDPAATEKLRRLGYMAYRSPVKAEELDRLPDPKQKIDELNAILEAQDAFRAGQVNRGRDLLSSVRQQDSHMYLVPFILAEAEMRDGNWGEAVKEFRESLDLNPDFDNSMTVKARA